MPMAISKPKARSISLRLNFKNCLLIPVTSAGYGGQKKRSRGLLDGENTKNCTMQLQSIKKNSRS